MSINTMKGRHGRQAGFSLTELMIVIVIIGILLGLVFSNLNVMGDAQNLKAKKEVGDLKVKLEMYRADNGSFPPSGALNALVTNPGNAPRWRQYMKALPKDPWGNDYRYLNPGTHGGEVDIYSIGPDKREGTEDDIGSWLLEQ
ncbi:type II secretion system major pseudopilin GspG [Candidatus Thiothrix sp. Deng01]|uniref:Type II secretion system core protein G n=1 Tax=Candidatus Thiothrix phosphatis TaxID=3112415 RepID=A0ABU6D0I0_9GAMM|nr:type II secretion system major pseudopilin GspG [Candidatus Thiothrix sp. Deng01]MEB4592163.1 type II secretion system major pseudopilin GspG [Candidatus Thiothrix sp. Deng01]